MSKKLSAKYYQENKKNYKKKLVGLSMVVIVTKISQNMKNKSLLNIEKNIIK